MRKEFPLKVKDAALKRSNGVCECHLVSQLPTFEVGCGCALGPGNTYFEHVNPDGLTGEPTLENCAALCRTCWALKTKTYDIPVIAKAKRVRRKHVGIRRPSRFACARNSKWKKKLDGSVVRR